MYSYELVTTSSILIGYICFPVNDFQVDDHKIQDNAMNNASLTPQPSKEPSSFGKTLFQLLPEKYYHGNNRRMCMKTMFFRKLYLLFFNYRSDEILSISVFISVFILNISVFVSVLLFQK